MMVAEQHPALLSPANRAVKIADELLDTTYPLTHDPKVLVRVAQTIAHGLDVTTQALAAFLRIELANPASVHNTIHERELPIPSASAAAQLSADLAVILSAHKDSHTVFSREEQLYIAEAGFERLHTLTQEHLRIALNTLKRFVYETHRYILTAGEPHD